MTLQRNSTVLLNPRAICTGTGGPKKAQIQPLKSFSIYCMRLTHSVNASGLCLCVQRLITRQFLIGQAVQKALHMQHHSSFNRHGYFKECSERSFLCDSSNALLIFMLDFERDRYETRPSHLLNPELMWQHLKIFHFTL